MPPTAQPATPPFAPPGLTAWVFARWPAAQAVFAKAAQTLYSWDQRRQGRRQLAKLDYCLLADIGLSEAERDRECRKPFWKA